MTHNERVLELLSDRKPHSHLEIYRLGVIAHSRVSDLRKRGYVIEQRREGDLYIYRLVSEPSLCESASPTRDAGADSQSEVVPGADGSQPPPRGATSLALFDAEEAERRAPAWA